VAGRNRLAGGGNPQGAAVAHHVAGVHRQVEDRHLELVGVGPGRGHAVGDIDDDLDLRPRGAGDEIGHAGDEACHVDRRRLQRLAPGKGEQALHQRLGPVGRLQRAVDQPLLAFPADAAAAQQVEAADDGRQQVVEVVRHAAGQLAHGLELLALAQRFLGLAPLGDVDRFGHDGDDVAVTRRARGAW
jgi:hypothetical protein